MIDLIQMWTASGWDVCVSERVDQIFGCVSG